MAEWIRRGSGIAEIPEPSVILDCRGGGEEEELEEEEEEEEDEEEEKEEAEKRRHVGNAFSERGTMGGHLTHKRQDCLLCSADICVGP